MFTRRRFLQTLGAFAVSTRAHPQPAPFSLGVASGYPTPSGVTLWTRLPFAASVRWELAADDTMRNVVRSGEVAASAE